jgi:bifunctional DNA-binding transcriptional regulator/antitoxin component of YhaV-PrlF toxin-antitoxin module
MSKSKTMFRRVLEAGKSSLMITIPKAWANDMRWEKGDFVRVWQEGNAIFVEKAK